MNDIPNKYSEESLIPEELDALTNAQGLDDLLGKKDFDILSGNLNALGINVYGVTYPEGQIFFKAGYTPEETLIKIVKYFTTHKKQKGQILTSGKTQIIFRPIEHDFEEIGRLWLGTLKSVFQDSKYLDNISSLVINMVQTVIQSSYKVFLTSSMHAKVVEDSYKELKQKNILLTKSERKYRALAESLDAEVKKKTKEIKDANTQLMQQEKMASIGQLAAGVAHEINNPIGFVNSNLGTLNNYCEDIVELITAYRKTFLKYNAIDEKQLEREIILKDLEKLSNMEKEIDLEYLLGDIISMIDESKEGVGRVKKIVQDLKDFAHPGQETPSHADINKNIDSTLNIVWNELKYKVKVIKDYGNLPLLNCYPRQLNQVFMNILINASHAIEKEGEISIKTRGDDDYIEIWISDNGVGISQENLQKIFDPFFTTKDVGKGTGLGLNLSYNIVNKHKGELKAISEVGKGSTFIIKLPINEDL